MTDKTEFFSDICMEMRELYKKKNTDYDDSFSKSYAQYGLVMPAIRLEDKLNRFKSLIKNSALVESESIEDTLIDIANYAVMTVMEIRGGNDNV